MTMIIMLNAIIFPHHNWDMPFLQWLSRFSLSRSCKRYTFLCAYMHKTQASKHSFQIQSIKNNLIALNCVRACSNCTMTLMCVCVCAHRQQVGISMQQQIIAFDGDMMTNEEKKNVVNYIVLRHFQFCVGSLRLIYTKRKIRHEKKKRRG